MARYNPIYYHVKVSENVREKIGAELTAVAKRDLLQQLPQMIDETKDFRDFLPPVGKIFTRPVAAPMVITCQIKNIEKNLVEIAVIDVEIIVQKGDLFPVRY